MTAPSLEAVEISGVFLAVQLAFGSHLTCAPSNFQRMTLTGLKVRESVLASGSAVRRYARLLRDNAFQKYRDWLTQGPISIRNEPQALFSERLVRYSIQDVVRLSSS